MFSSEARWVSHAPQQPFHGCLSRLARIGRTNTKVWKFASSGRHPRHVCTNLSLLNILQKISHVPLLSYGERHQGCIICEFWPSWLGYRERTVSRACEGSYTRKDALGWSRLAPFTAYCSICCCRQMKLHPEILLKCVVQFEGSTEILTSSRA